MGGTALYLNNISITVLKPSQEHVTSCQTIHTPLRWLDVAIFHYHIHLK